MERDISRFVGKAFEPFQFVIERGKIKEFALAIGDDNPIYYQLEAAITNGYRDIPIPLTFPTAAEMWAGTDFDQLIVELQMNPLRVLHGEQEYQYLGEICAGDVLTGQTRVASAATKRNMNFFVLETEYHNQQKELVLRSRSTVIERLGEEM